MVLLLNMNTSLIVTTIFAVSIKNFNTFLFEKWIYIRHQFRFQHSDGSFSAFGNSDKYGSLWLSAFVLKCFKHATLLEDGVADQLNDKIRQIEKFILQSYNNTENTFKDLGKVYDRYLQVS